MEIEANGTTIHCELEGPEDAPILVFSNSLATSLDMWRGQVEGLKDRYRILRYDNRGHGRTPPTPGPYTIGLLARDLLGVLDALGIGKVSFCGLSKGGMVGQWLGINAPERVERLVLSNTTAFFPDKEMWRERIEMAEGQGIPAIAEASIRRWFTAPFREDPANAAILDEARAFILPTTLEGYLNCAIAIRDMDFRAELPSIRTPTLVIVGDQDPATIPAYGELIAERVPGARLATIRSAAHLSNIEQADVFTKTLVDFLENGSR